jgi:YD repeat-containing protein
VAFDSDRDGERAVYVAERSGEHVTRVSGRGYAAVPSWSPNGTQLAFIKAEADRAQVWNLWLMDVATGELQRHTSFRSGQVWGASWFPDGRRVAYSHEDRLVLLDLRSGADEIRESPIKGRLVRTPAVSPDGRRIVFQVYGDGVWMLDVVTGKTGRVLDDVTAEEFAWDPDGRRIAYHSRRDGQWRIWLMVS